MGQFVANVTLVDIIQWIANGDESQWFVGVDTKASNYQALVMVLEQVNFFKFNRTEL